jgi:hypothetical protein
LFCTFRLFNRLVAAREVKRPPLPVNQCHFGR